MIDKIQARNNLRQTRLELGKDLFELRVLNKITLDNLSNEAIAN